MNKGIEQVRNILNKDQKGITGLETAIVLIAFVVVASVFAFAVITTGLFSSEEDEIEETPNPRDSLGYPPAAYSTGS